MERRCSGCEGLPAFRAPSRLARKQERSRLGKGRFSEVPFILSLALLITPLATMLVVRDLP